MPCSLSLATRDFDQSENVVHHDLTFFDCTLKTANSRVGWLKL